MATPSSPPIRMSQVKAEFNKGNRLRQYLGCAPGVPSSGTIKLTDLLGKDAFQYYMAYPFSWSFADLGYLYSFVGTDNPNWWASANHPEIPNATHLNQSYPSDNWGINTNYDYSSYEGAIVNCGDIGPQMNAFSYLEWAGSDQSGYFASRWQDMELGTGSSWLYSNAVSANATYLYAYGSSAVQDKLAYWSYQAEIDNTYSAQRMK